MRICHATPHLPPDQAANALLPFHLGTWARDAGDACTFVAHEPRQAPGATLRPVDWPGSVTWVPRRWRTGRPTRYLASLVAAASIVRLAAPRIAEADLVHVHSNGLLPELCAWLAARRSTPVVLTLYGTEIWHYRPKRGIDLFTRAYRRASHVTFYSQGLADRAGELGLARQGVSVVYPPVAAEFRVPAAGERDQARRLLGLGPESVLLNVKRLHPLAGQRSLIEAMPMVLGHVPGTRLILCGTGPLAADLQALARARGVERQVRFAGLVDNRTVAQYAMAADLFVLPSLLEACPTVALEALACGTPVVSSDNPGGVELARLFGADMVVVPREDARALASAIAAALTAGRRVSPVTQDLIERRFRPAAVWSEYRAIYERVSR